MRRDVTKHHAGQLDSLRAIAVVAVIFSHSIAIDVEWGSYAVYLFFVLSGFLITSQILAAADARERRGDSLRAPLLRFYGRRALRLFPAYYVAILGAAAVGIAGMRQELPWHMVQASNLLFALHPETQANSSAGHLWSLNVEEQFYLAWPMLVLLVPRRLLLLPILIGILIGIYAWMPDNVLPPILASLSILDSLDSLGVGALIGLATHQRWPIRLLWPLAILAGACCVIALYFAGVSGEGGPPWLQLAIHETMLIAFAALVLAATDGIGGPAGRLLDLAPLRYLGTISYGMYLYHIFVMAFYWKLCAHFGWPVLSYGLALFPPTLIATILVSMLSWRFIERPVNRYRRHLSYPPRPLDPALTPPPASAAAPVARPDPRSLPG